MEAEGMQEGGGQRQYRIAEVEEAMEVEGGQEDGGPGTIQEG